MGKRVTDSPRFLVAKYAPDMQRMEPRNIGIVLWSAGTVAWRFLGTDSLPSFVANENSNAYREWVLHWSRLLDADAIKVRGSKPVPKSSPQFLDAFRANAKGNYMLAPGGVLLGRVQGREVEGALDELFGVLVEEDRTRAPREVSSDTLARRGWKRLIERTGLKERKDYQRNYRCSLEIRGVRSTMEFNAALGNGNGKPHAVFQFAAVEKQQSVYSVSFMFENAVREELLEKQQCAAVCYVENGHADDVLGILRGFGEVINVAHPKRAMASLLAMDIPPESRH